jgi:DnaJ-class molecular chaperone
MYNLSPEITEERRIVRRWKAWQECVNCNGVGIDPQDARLECPECKDGSGGWWHPMVIDGGWDNKDPMLSNDSGHIYLVDDNSPTYEQAKSSTLVHSGVACDFVGCNGTGEHVKYGPEQFFMEDPNMKVTCEMCQGTGIQGDGTWEVE